MKENSLSGEDGKTPNPLPTPQPATKMEEEIRECPHCKGNLERYEDPKAVKIIESLHSQLATAQAQLRRKDEALKRILADAPYPSGHVFNIARAALADGKEGGK